MSMPRQILPGSTYLVTRRCSERRFFLRPSSTVNRIFLYCLACAAAKYGIQVHAFVALSDHYHMVVTDPEARIPGFMSWFNEFVAKCLNALLGRWESIWSGGTYSLVRLETPDDVLDKIVYTIVNPIAAGLVPRSEQWPGATSRTFTFPAKIDIERPGSFFRPDGPMPEKVALTVTRPPGFEHLTGGQFRELLVERLRTREAELRAEAKKQGRGFLGVKAVERQDPCGSPATREPRRKLDPKIAAKDPEVRQGAIDRLRAFLDEYRKAFERWRAGIRKVVFPFGTYALRVLAGVACRAP
ncbi:MAG: transposase [Myxococcota bacterium]|nr:transposase [Myxococcota bacterium]